jgi:hypothetical protein
MMPTPGKMISIPLPSCFTYVFIPIPAVRHAIVPAAKNKNAITAVMMLCKNVTTEDNTINNSPKPIIATNRLTDFRILFCWLLLSSSVGSADSVPACAGRFSTFASSFLA